MATERAEFLRSWSRATLIGLQQYWQDATWRDGMKRSQGRATGDVVNLKRVGPHLRSLMFLRVGGASDDEC